MSVPECYIKVSALMDELGRKVDKTTLRKMAVRLDNMRAEALSPDEFNKTASAMFSEIVAKSAAATRAQKLLDLQTRVRARDAILKSSDKLNIFERLDAYIRGASRKMGDSVNLSIDHMASSIGNPLKASIRSLLMNKEGDFRIAEMGKLTREITQEMDALQRGDKPGISGSAQAARIAKVYHGVLNRIGDLKAAYSPAFERIDDYFHRATHSRDKIQAVGEDEWVGFAMSHYGKKSFPELEGEEKVDAFRQIYREIKSGIYGFTVNRGGPNLADKMAKSRTLIPNDWQSFWEYNQRFGDGNVHSAVLRAVDSASKDIAIMTKFGSNPSDFFGKLLRDLSLSPEDAQLIELNRNKLLKRFEAMTSPGYAPAHNGLYAKLQGVIHWQALAKLGSAYLSSWSDIAVAATIAADASGKNFLTQMAEVGASYAKYFLKNESARLAAAEDMGLFHKSVIYNLHAEMGSPDMLKPGRISKLISLQSTVNLMDRHIQAMNAAVGDVLSRNLGRNADRAFDSLNPQVQQSLRRYGIGQLEWDLLRKYPEDWSGAEGFAKSDGPMGRFINGNSVLGIPDEDIAQYAVASGLWKGAGKVSKKGLDRARSDLQMKIGTMINQLADSSTSTFSQADRAFWGYGNSPDTFLGLGVRMIMQFKSAQLKNFDTMMRSAYSNPSKAGADYAKIARFALTSGGLFAMGQMANQIFSGKTPEDPTSPEFILKSLAGSGAGGILTDAIVSEAVFANSVSQLAEGVVSSLAGPAAGTLGTVAAVGARSVMAPFSDDVDLPAKDLARLAKSNIPFQNLFYIKGPLHYYLLDNAVEMTAPGYIRTRDKNMRKKDDIFGEPQDYFLPELE